ncbi:hypothetical protein [Kosakonia sp. MUSA4]|uniref:hypothetical protein n=1 Tax=Kosakonia sp. MUSA4 TaxID=2067958 RepID=UPI001ABF3185|nr:hypothetical protein [Kosakonia sp. MUSA4]
MKRKTLFFFLLAKLFLIKTKFVRWLHLDIFSPPKSKAKKIIHALFLPIIERYIRTLDSIFFLSKKTLAEISEKRNLNPAKCHFIRWSGDKEFYKYFQQDDLSDDIISTGRENRDLPVVFNALANTNIKVDFYTSDTSQSDFYHNIKGDFKINKDFWQYNTLLEKVSVAKAMIIPLRQDKINYCVGLSSLIEAIALGRPVITTYNPYWYVDIEAEISELLFARIRKKTGSRHLIYWLIMMSWRVKCPRMLCAFSMKYVILLLQKKTGRTYQQTFCG